MYDFRVKTGHNELNILLAKIAKENGFDGAFEYFAPRGEIPYDYVLLKGKKLNASRGEGLRAKKEVTIPEFINLLKNNNKIFVGNDEVIFSEDGLTIGCTFVDKETVEKIIDRWKNEV